MYPMRNMTDYKTEMNRLFSRIDKNEYLSTPHTNQSFSQSLKSSSSETSPESFPEVMRDLFPVGPDILSPVRPDQSPAKPDQGLLRLGDNHQFDLSTPGDLDFTLPHSLYETPMAKYERQIVGRKIILENRFDDTKTVYEELQQTPPKLNPRQFYELFPTENRNELQPLQNCTPPKVDFKSNLDLSLKYGMSNDRPRFNMSNDTSPSNQKSYNASPKYELPFDFSPNRQQMCNANSRFDKVSNDTSRYDRMSHDTPRFDRMSNNTLRYDRKSNETLRYDRMPNDFPRFDRMPNDASRYDRMIDNTYETYYQNSNEFQRYRMMSNDMAMFETMSNDTTMFDAMSNDTTMFDAMSNDMAMYETMSNDASMFDTMSMGSRYYQMLNNYSENVSPMTSPVSRCRSNSTVSTQKMVPFKEPIITPSTSSKNGNKMCMFCRKNGETPLVYMTHKVKEKIGNRHVVTCPILRSHICSSCGATGDDSHTISYCPLLRRSNNGQPLPSTTVSLKSTRVKSNGMVRRRY